MKGGDDVDIIRQGWDDGCGSFILITDGLRGGGVTRAMLLLHLRTVVKATMMNPCHRDKNFQCHEYLHTSKNQTVIEKKLVLFDSMTRECRKAG